MTAVAVCGTGGLLGRALCDRATVRGLTVRPVRWQQPGATWDEVYGAVALINAAGVVNHAASPAEVVEGNALLPHRLHAAAGRAGVPFLQVSTDCVYGDPVISPTGPTGVHPKLHTTGAVAPASLYARAKLAGECGIVLRTSFVGPGAGLWQDVVLALRAGLDYPGWNYVWWSGGHVLDVADYLLDLALDPPATGVYNLATALPISKLGLVRLIAHAEGLDQQRIYDYPWMAGDRAMLPDLPPLPPCRPTGWWAPSAVDGDSTDPD